MSCIIWDGYYRCIVTDMKGRPLFGGRTFAGSEHARYFVTACAVGFKIEKEVKS